MTIDPQHCRKREAFSGGAGRRRAKRPSFRQVLDRAGPEFATVRPGELDDHDERSCECLKTAELAVREAIAAAPLRP